MDWINKEIDDDNLIFRGNKATLYRLGQIKFWHPNKMIVDLYGASIITFHRDWEFRDADSKKKIDVEKIIKANGGANVHHVPERKDPVAVNVNSSLLHE